MIITYIFCLFLNITSVNAAEVGGNSGGGSGIALTPNVPHIYNLSYETLNRSSHLTYAFSGGYVPPITISTATVSVLSLDARVRWHPFGGAFFLGTIGGYHSYSGSGNTTLSIAAQSVPVTVTDKLSGMYITPHVGWLWIFGKLLIGLEGGTQIGVGSTNNISLAINDPTMQSLATQIEADPIYQTFKTNIDNSITTLTSLPYVGLKLGWKF